MDRCSAVGRHQCMGATVVSGKLPLKHFDIAIGVLAVPTVTQRVDDDGDLVVGDRRPEHEFIRNRDCGPRLLKYFRHAMLRYRQRIRWRYPSFQYVGGVRTKL